MAERLQSPFPIWRAQYQLLGGNRRMLGLFFGYFGALVFGLIVAKQSFRRETFGVIADWFITFLTWPQMITAVAGCTAIHKSMLRDHQTKMIESHRLTPMSNVTVVLGYMFGATLQMDALFIAGFLFGGWLIFTAGHNVSDWLGGNVLIINGAVSLRAASTFWGFRTLKPTNPTPILVTIGVLASAMSGFPALGLVTGIYSVGLGMFMLSGKVSIATVGSSVGILIGVHLLMTGFWIYCAAVRYRRPDLPVFNLLRGSLLLLLWLMFTVGGLIAAKLIRNLPQMVQSDIGMEMAKWIGVLVSSMLVALFVIFGASECRRLTAEGRAPRDRWDRAPDWFAPVLASGLILAATLLTGTSYWTPLLDDFGRRVSRRALLANQPIGLVTSAAIFVGLATAWALLHARIGGRKKPALRAATFLILLWFGPVLLDLIRMAIAAADGKNLAEFSWITTLSPIGTIISVWTFSPAGFEAGLIFQVLLFAILCLVGFVRRTSKR